EVAASGGLRRHALVVLQPDERALCGVDVPGVEREAERLQGRPQADVEEEDQRDEQERVGPEGLAGAEPQAAARAGCVRGHELERSLELPPLGTERQAPRRGTCGACLLSRRSAADAR